MGDRVQHVVDSFSKKVETLCCFSLVVSIVSQVNAAVAFPSYNAVIACWGLFASFASSGNALLALTCFITLSIVLDIVFLSIWSPILLGDQVADKHKTTNGFGATMMIVNLMVKTVLVYYSTQLTVAVGRLEETAGRKQAKSHAQHLGSAGQSQNGDSSRFAGDELRTRSPPPRKPTPQHSPTNASRESASAVGNSGSPMRQVPRAPSEDLEGKPPAEGNSARRFPPHIPPLRTDNLR